jgi:integrase/recombinase XerD
LNMTRSNVEIFSNYEKELKLRIHSLRNLGLEKSLLRKFQDHLGERKPTVELAKQFISLYTDRSKRTLIRYATTIKGFMKWYGEPIEDLKIKRPRTLPPYIEDEDIERLLKAIDRKRASIKVNMRDRLLVELALKTGMRRGELANLVVGDIHDDFLIVRQAKGNRDRMIPLITGINLKLHRFINGKKPEDSVFNLTGPSISNKIRRLAKKAGLEKIHTHALRHKFATALIEHGADIHAAKEILGHSDLSTTQVYLSVTDKRLREAIETLEKPKKMAKTWPVTLKTMIKVQIKPETSDNWYPKTQIFTYDFFAMELESNAIIIESLQVRTSDPSAPFQIMLYESNLVSTGIDWRVEDIIRMDPVTTRVYTYPVGQPLPYKNTDGSKKLYGGIGAYQRSLPVELLDETKKEERIEYLKRIIDFEITLRYRL